MGSVNAVYLTVVRLRISGDCYKNDCGVFFLSRRPGALQWLESPSRVFFFFKKKNNQRAELPRSLSLSSSFHT